ncbi:MAG: homoserine dehydrogenase [Candidatus Omnitrophica bacterium CG11_big_fil_rev_8_21_14_0_20_63_9]|nr:MAG: homoserine dehydrogenase [Candidatus Omnitrophica bacterium CG11_big_fil_rev_8_21_14_0_20_63_9]
MSNKVNVGIIGFGTVGAGVARALLEKGALLEQRIGARPVLRRVCDRDFRRSRGFRLPAGMSTTDPADILRDPDIQVVVELIGGLEPAKSFILEALRQGKHVVTANKALLAHAGRELFNAAAKSHTDLYFEASVGGGIPIIKGLREGLVANEIDAIIGIVNGTSNYVLTQMRERRLSFHEALLQAKQHGYAERNPSLDIDGHDASHKLAILTLLGFGMSVKLEDMYIEGISKISQADIQYADELGYCIKPVVIAKRVDHELEVRVHPTLLEKTHLLANVNGVYNAIYVHGDMVGGALFYGRGAGQNPAASSVVADIADVVRNIASGATQRIPLGKPVAHGIRRVRRMGSVETRYYMRFMVTDKPGVLAKISGVLGRHHISIATVHQKERKAARIVPVVMMSHEAKESNVRAALQAIDRLGFVKRPTVAIRTEAPRSQ